MEMNATINYLAELIREKFDNTKDYWEASNLIDKCRSFGIHELDELADEMHNDLKSDIQHDSECKEAKDKAYREHQQSEI